jgi:hypothetical protein
VKSTKSRSWTDGPFGRLLGFAPIPAPPQVFALTPTRLRYAAFSRDGAGWRLVDGREVALPADAFQHGPLGGPLRDPAAFGGLLAELLQRVAAPVRDASLLIPDAWLRVTFAESAELPKQASARDEVLRWRLKRLVPFRVDELAALGRRGRALSRSGGTAPRAARFRGRGPALPARADLHRRRHPAGSDLESQPVAARRLARFDRRRAQHGGRGRRRRLHLDLRPTGGERARAGAAPLQGVDWGPEPRGACRAGGARPAPDAHVSRGEPAGGARRRSLAARRALACRTTGDDWLGWLRDGLGCPARPLGAEQVGAVPGGLPAGVFGWPMEAAPLLGAACREVS